MERIEEDISRSSHLPVGARSYGCIFDGEKWRVCITNERRSPFFIRDFDNEPDALEFLLAELRETAVLEEAERIYKKSRQA